MYIIYSASIFLLNFKLFISDNMLAFTTVEFLMFCILFIILFLLLHVISIILHEIGHLLFGIKAELNFISFNILGFTIKNDNNKLKIKKVTNHRDVGGFCQMAADKNKSYDKKKICLYYMGGIIFNLIFIVIFVFLLLNASNEYLKLLYLNNIVINVYFVLTNSIPFINMNSQSDMSHLVNYLNDEYYILLYSNINSSEKILDLDESMLRKPKKIKDSSDIFNVIFYIEYKIVKKQYDIAFEYANYILKNYYPILSKDIVNGLKIQIIDCVFNGNYDLKLISDYWNNDLSKYLNKMSYIVPQYLGINYMYSLLIEKDKRKAEKYLNRFQILKEKLKDKNAILETKKIICDTNNYQNNGCKF